MPLQLMLSSWDSRKLLHKMGPSGACRREQTLFNRTGRRTRICGGQAQIFPTRSEAQAVMAPGYPL